MFKALFQRAEATVDHVIAGLLMRIVVAIPFLVAAGFATAAATVYLVAELGAQLGPLIMAGIFTLIGLVAMLVVGARQDSAAATEEMAATHEQSAASHTEAGGIAQTLGEIDQAALNAAVTVVGPLAAAAAGRILLRNLPLVAAIGAAGFVLTRDTHDRTATSVQPAE